MNLTVFLKDFFLTDLSSQKSVSWNKGKKAEAEGPIQLMLLFESFKSNSFVLIL